MIRISIQSYLNFCVLLSSKDNIDKCINDFKEALLLDCAEQIIRMRLNGKT